MHLIVLCLYKIYLTDQGKCVLDGTVAKVIAIVIAILAEVNLALTIALITIAIITIAIIAIAISTIAIITIAIITIAIIEISIAILTLAKIAITIAVTRVAPQPSIKNNQLQIYNMVFKLIIIQDKHS